MQVGVLWLVATFCAGLIGGLAIKVSDALFATLARFKKIEVQVASLFTNERWYFPAPLDLKEVEARLEEHPLAEPYSKDPIDPYSWRNAVFLENGGIPELSMVKIRITNVRKEHVAVVDARSRVVGRSPASFAAKYSPPRGGPYNVVYLAFDLDRDSSPAVEVDPEQLPTSSGTQVTGGKSYFSRHNLIIPPDGVVEFFAVPETSRAEVIEWTVDLKIDAKNWLGKLRSRTVTVRHGGGVLRGASSAARAATAYQAIAGY